MCAHYEEKVEVSEDPLNVRASAGVQVAAPSPDGGVSLVTMPAMVLCMTFLLCQAHVSLSEHATLRPIRLRLTHDQFMTVALLRMDCAA